MTRLKFEVLRSYTVVDVYHIEAENEAEAIRKAQQGEGHVKTYDGDYDDDVTVEALDLEGNDQK